MISFNIFPHKNIKGTHKATLEFTKEAELTLRGDCIIGVKADFDVKKLKELKGKCELTIKCGNLTDSLTFTVNPDFHHEEELVIRKSDFNSSRTFGIKASKGAADLDRQLIRKLKEEEGKVLIREIK